MQFGSHHARRNRRIGFHKFSRVRFIRRLENRNTKCFVAWFHGAIGQNQLTGLNRWLEIGEMSIDGSLVFSGPRLVVVQARHEMQNVNELFRFSRRLRRLRTNG